MLTGGELTLSQDTLIDGDQNNDGIKVTLDGGAETRLLRIQRESGGQNEIPDVTISDLGLQSGQSSHYSNGGAIYFGGGGTLSLLGCEISGNNAGKSSGEFYEDGDGGAIYAQGGALIAVNCNITQNLADGGYGRGGAISASNSFISIKNSVVSGNRARLWLAVGNRHPTADRSVYRRTVNSVEQSAASASMSSMDFGGAIYGIDATGVISGSSIVRNASCFGGGIDFSGRLGIYDSTLAGNTAFSMAE